MRIYNHKGEIRGTEFKNPEPEKPKKKNLTEQEEEDYRKLLFVNDFKIGSPGNDRPRLYVRNRNFPGVGISRSFGDYLGHKIGMTSEPVVGATKMNKNNKFLIIASRAVWNVMTPKEVFTYIEKHKLLSFNVLAKQLAY